MILFLHKKNAGFRTQNANNLTSRDKNLFFSEFYTIRRIFKKN
jgi:hypothetical protein